MTSALRKAANGCFFGAALALVIAGLFQLNTRGADVVTDIAYTIISVYVAGAAAALAAIGGICFLLDRRRHGQQKQQRRNDKSREAKNHG